MRNPSPFAIISLGSNSFNMLLVQEGCSAYQILAKFKRKIRLASYITAGNQLSDEGVAVALDCLQWFKSELTQHAVTDDATRVVATATIRTINNAHQIAEPALKQFGFKIQTISGLEEASFIYKGSQADSRALVIDIGGASTEIIKPVDSGQPQMVSFEFGSVSVTETFLKGRTHIQADLFEQIRQTIHAQIFAHADWLLADSSPINAVGLSGSIQSLIEVQMARGQMNEITFEIVANLKAELMNQPIEDFSVIGLPVERKPNYVAAVAIIYSLFEILKIQSLSLSKGALREGLILSYLDGAL